MGFFSLTVGDDLFPTRQNVTKDDIIFAGSGNDTVFAGAGMDYISAGSGDDLIHGDAGDDKLFSEGGQDRLYGDAGNDTVTVALDGQAILVDGGEGRDLLEIEVPAQRPPVVITAVAVEGGFRLDGLGITAFGIETVLIGSGGRLNFSGGDEADQSYGAMGSRVALGGGDDFMLLTLAAKGPVSVLNGGTGRDTLFLDFTAAAGGATARVDALGMGHIKTGATWAGTFAEFETLIVRGTDLGDTINVAGKSIRLVVEDLRGGGNDNIQGGKLGDSIAGHAGMDTIFGWGGADDIRGGTGADMLSGGQDSDTFHFAPGDADPGAWDTITDFRARYGDVFTWPDVIDLSDFGGLTFIAQADFTAAQQVHAQARDGAVWIEVNTTGTSEAEFVLKLANLTDATLINADHFRL